LIGDERTEDEFTVPASEIERLYYGFSVSHCLPVGMVGESAAGTRTAMRAETVRRYADEAGFASCEVLPIEHYFWRRFYWFAFAPEMAITAARQRRRARSRLAA
jgi:hypothetical protein